ncbi:hypothetical protein BGS_0570 [Beggiatoa sp. SS]|nr:hypothetical protein BGS_0570 [Beggiatoa sp. SS]
MKKRLKALLIELGKQPGADIVYWMKSIPSLGPGPLSGSAMDALYHV